MMSKPVEPSSSRKSRLHASLLLSRTLINRIQLSAVMPTGGWQGLTESDNSQAVAIAKVMAEFTAEGIEVWLRFAHEVGCCITSYESRP